MAGKKTTDKDSSAWIGSVEKYSRKIWLAGLGLYSKVDQDGPKLFDALVKDGEKAEKQARKQVGAAPDGATAAASRGSGMKARALGKWSELEDAVDKRLSSAISRLGVPSRDELQAMQQQIATLTTQIDQLIGHSAAVAQGEAEARRAATGNTRPVKAAAAKAGSKAASGKTAAKPLSSALASSTGDSADSAAKTDPPTTAKRAARKPGSNKSAAGEPAAQTPATGKRTTAGKAAASSAASSSAPAQAAAARPSAARAKAAKPSSARKPAAKASPAGVSPQASHSAPASTSPAPVAAPEQP